MGRHKKRGKGTKKRPPTKSKSPSRKSKSPRSKAATKIQSHMRKTRQKILLERKKRATRKIQNAFRKTDLCGICLNLVRKKSGRCHNFHDHCIKTWIDMGNSECPMCKKPIQLDEENQDNTNTFENFIRLPDVQEILHEYGRDFVEKYYNEVHEDDPDRSIYGIEESLREMIDTWATE